MEKWIATPMVSVNNVLLGSPREEVRKAMNCEYKEFKKTPSSKNTTDDFGICHIYYDENNLCQAIEIFDDVEVEINGTVIFPGKVDALKSFASDFEEVESGNYISKSCSIGIYAPDGAMEGILLAVKGYF